MKAGMGLMRRKSDRLVVACTAISVLCAAVVAVFAATVLDTHSTTRQIQDERAASVLRSCQETNGRHDATIGALDELMARAGVGASYQRLVLLEQSRMSTVLLVNALAPKQDCKRLVSSRVRTKP